MEKFNTYTFSDFLDDDSFVSLVKYNRDTERVIWQQWLNTNPPNIEIYNSARTYLLTILSAKPVVDSVDAQDELWVRINEGIAQNQRRTTKVRRLRVWSASAAAAVLLMVTGLWYYQSQVTITTGFGQQQTVTLPDHSVVKLNANSSLSYYRAWNWHAVREVWLKGEGFFSVIHLNRKPDHVKPSEQFFAHAANVRVQVLGTEFNIKARRNQVLVALIKGKISVQHMGSSAQPLIINPGDAVESRNNQLRKLPITTMSNKPLAWTGHKMVVTGITVAGIIENYEDTYGGQIILENPSLSNKRIDGTISLQSKESTLYMLANLLNATVEQRDDGTYYLKSNHTR